MILDIPEVPIETAIYDTTGTQVDSPVLQKGLNRVSIPVSGLLKIIRY